MEEKDVFDLDRGENYTGYPPDIEVILPVTKLGFESLVAAAAKANELPVTDAIRAVVAGYIHHIPNEVNTVTLSKLATVVHKSVANSTSWRIDQDIKIKRKAEIEAAQKEAASLHVVENEPA